jgi:hypothetical protein
MSAGENIPKVRDNEQVVTLFKGIMAKNPWMKPSANARDGRNFNLLTVHCVEP